MSLNIMKSTGSSYQSSAKIVDGNLILSLPDAINPVVWRMELGSVKSSALEVRQASDAGPHLLSLKTPKGDVHDIAPYAAREDAVRALMRVSAALQGGQGKIIPATTAFPADSATSVSTENGGMKWLLALGGVLAVIFLFAYVSGSTPQAPVTNAPMADMATTANGAPNVESGVPQSADDLLGGLN